MAINAPVWGIDIGQNALKALKLERDPATDQVIATAFDYIEHSKILSQPDADAEALTQEALSTFLSRNDLKGTRVAVAVPGQTGLVRFIKLPPVEKKKIPDIVKFEARQQIPFALEEVIWDYQVLGPAADEDMAETEIGLFAMKRDAIARVMQPFRAAGIEVDLVQMSPLALYNFVAYDQLEGKFTKNEPVMVLSIGTDTTDLVITDGERIWQRNINLGGNNFTRALTKELKLTFAKAEHLKRNATKAQDPKAIFQAMRSTFNDFVGEVQRSIGYYSSTNRQAKIQKVIALGNAFKLPGLQKFLQQNLQYDVEKPTKFNRLEGEQVLNSPQFQDNILSFPVVYGLGVQGLGLAPIKTNLLPPEIVQVRMIRRKKPWALAAAACLVLGLTAYYAGSTSLLSAVDTNHGRWPDALQKFNAANSKSQSEKKSFDAALSQWKDAAKSGQDLLKPVDDRSLWLEFFKTFDEAIPKDRAAPAVVAGKEGQKAPDVGTLNQVDIDDFAMLWSTDVKADWFDPLDTISPFAKKTIDPYDQKNPPQGSGWIVTINGHHFNNQALFFVLNRILPNLRSPQLRAIGVNNPLVVWMNVDTKWYPGEPGTIAARPPLPSARAAAAGSAGATGMPGGMAGGAPGGAAGGMPGGAMGMYGKPGGGAGGMPSNAMAGGPKGMGMGMGRMSGGANPFGAGGLRPGFGARPGAGQGTERAPTSALVRTDFQIQFIWKPTPPSADDPGRVKAIAAIQKEMEATQTATKGQQPQLTQSDLEKLSTVTSKATTGTAEAGAKPAPAAPGTTPAPAPGTTTPAPAPGTTAPAGATPAGTPPAAGASNPTAPAPAIPPPPAGGAAGAGAAAPNR